MNDPRQPLPGGAPRPAGIPQQPHAPQQIPGAPRPVMRPPGAPQQQPHPVQPQHPHPVQPQHTGGTAKIAGMPTLQAGIPAGDEGSIALIEDGLEAATLHKKIKAFGPEGIVRQSKWNRPSAVTPESAVRVRTFHAKLSDQGLEYLDEAINHYLDEHPDIHVKFVTTNVGMFDGKFKDFALVVNIWY